MHSSHPVHFSLLTFIDISIPLSSCIKASTCSSAVPSSIFLSVLASGVKIFFTWVGDPSVRDFSHPPDIRMRPFLISAFFAAILPFSDGSLGTFSSFTTVSSTGSDDSTTSYPSSISLCTINYLLTSSIFRIYEICGMSRNSAVSGPTCAVSPSIACLPQRMTSAPILRSPLKGE